MFLITSPCETSTVLKVVYFILELIKVAFILIPTGLAVIATIDLAKNVISSDEKDMKKNLNLTIKRFIMCIIAFIIPAVVVIFVNLLENNNIAIDYTICITNANLEKIKSFEEEEEVIKSQEAADKLYVSNYTFKDPTNNRNVVASSNKKNDNSDDEDNEETDINVSGDAKGLVDALDKMSDTVKRDYKRGKKWKYSNSSTSGSFEKAVSKGKRKTNCAKYVSWALVEAGILKSGQSFYKKPGSSIHYSNSDAEKRMKAGLKYISGGNKSAKSLAKAGKLQAGDIILWNIRHTNVYAGDGKFYDAGHFSSMNGCNHSTNTFKTLGPGKISSLWNGHYKVWKILRMK